MATPRKGYRKDVIITQSERKPPFRKLIRRLRRHHLRQGRPPFVALRHFPRFIGDIYPAREGKWLAFVLRSSGLPRFARNDGFDIIITYTLRGELPFREILRVVQNDNIINKITVKMRLLRRRRACSRGEVEVRLRVRFRLLRL